MIISFKNLSFAEYVVKQREYGLDQLTFFRMRKRGLAPLNFDADTKRQARMIGSNLKKRFGKKKDYLILFRKSPSRRGWHFCVFHKKYQLFLPIKKILRMRKKYGDCYGRQNADKARANNGLAISILFNHKGNRWCTAWRDLKYLKEIK